MGTNHLTCTVVGFGEGLEEVSGQDLQSCVAVYKAKMIFRSQGGVGGGEILSGSRRYMQELVFQLEGAHCLMLDSVCLFEERRNWISL